MILLYVYIIGYVLTTFGLLVHLKYRTLEKDYYGRITRGHVGGGDIFVKFLHALVWPFIIMYLGAAQVAISLKNHQEFQLNKRKEQQKILSEQKKLLKEAGIY